MKTIHSTTLKLDKFNPKSSKLEEVEVEVEARIYYKEGSMSHPTECEVDSLFYVVEVDSKEEWDVHSLSKAERQTIGAELIESFLSSR